MAGSSGIVVLGILVVALVVVSGIFITMVEANDSSRKTVPTKFLVAVGDEKQSLKQRI